MREIDAVVVGAGVMGAATAWRLSHRGLRVALIEQFQAGHDRGSSHGRARVFRFSYDDAAYVRMAMEALPLWRALEASAGREIVRMVGGLDTGASAPVEANARALELAGAPFELMDGREAMRRFPTIRLEPFQSVLHQPDAGVIAADRALDAFLAAAAALGTELHERSPVLGLREASGRVHVATAEETYDAAVAVVTAGAWVRRVLAGTGIEVPVVPSRETVAFFRNPGAERLPILVEWGDHAMYGVASPGQGLKAGGHHLGPDTDPDVQGHPDTQVVERLSEWVARHYPGAEPGAFDSEACLYTNTDDERFILERHGSIVVGSACSGHGFKFAPLIGERLAELASPRW